MCSMLPWFPMSTARSRQGACAPVALKRSCRPAGPEVVAARPGRPPATGNVRALALSLSVPARSFIRWSAIPILASLLWLWKLCPAKIPDRQTSQRPAPKRHPVPLDSARRPSQPGQLTSIARPAICFSVLPTLCHQRSRGAVKSPNVYHIRSQRMSFRRTARHSPLLAHDHNPANHASRRRH